jgi:8-oxo-dGTP pyrophosphatase MutT (NUDIX family)
LADRREAGADHGVFAGLIERLVPRLGPLDVPAASFNGVIHAAVVLVLRADPTGAEILFIKRSEREGDPWSGHLALPGGRAERSDASLAAVALREVREEVGIDLERGGRILGSLPMVRPLSTRLPPIAVTPFLATAPEGAAARPDPDEVEDAFWMPLSALTAGGRSAVVRREVRGEIGEWPAYPSPRGPIWGITERILTGFLSLL